MIALTCSSFDYLVLEIGRRPFTKASFWNYSSILAILAKPLPGRDLIIPCSNAFGRVANGGGTG